MHSQRPQLAAVLQLRSRLVRASPSTKRALVIAAWSIIAVGVLLALRKSPVLPSHYNWAYIAVLIAASAPLSLSCNAAGLIETAHILAKDYKFPSALLVVTTGTIANQLPIPASFAMRVGAMRATGAGLFESFDATVSVSLIWLGSATCAASIAGYLLGANNTAVLLLLAAFSAYLYGIWRLGKHSRHRFAKIALLGVALSLIEAARLFVGFRAIGIHASFIECILLSAAGALAITVVPGGLGIREFGAAALAAFTTVTPAQALIAATLSRIAGLLSAGILLVFLQITRKDATRT